MSTKYSIDDVMSKLTSLTSEVRELRRELGDLRRSQVAATQPAAAARPTDPNRGRHYPGTGWIPEQHSSTAPPVAGPPVASEGRTLPTDLVDAGRAGIDATRAALRTRTS